MFLDNRTPEQQEHDDHLHPPLSFLHRMKKKEDVTTYQNANFEGKSFQKNKSPLKDPPYL